jgi:hypothetical protein
MRLLRLVKSIVLSLLKAFADATLRSAVVVLVCVLLGGLAQHLLRDYPMVSETWYLRWAPQAIAVAAPYDSLLSHQGPHLSVTFFSALWSIVLIGVVAALGRLPWKMLILAIPLMFVWIGWPLQRLRLERDLQLNVIQKAQTALAQGDTALVVRLASDPAVQQSHQAEALELRAFVLELQGSQPRAKATRDSLAPLLALLPRPVPHR